MKICPTCLQETKRLYKLDIDIDLVLCLDCKHTYQNYKRLYATVPDEDEIEEKKEKKGKAV